MSTQVSRRGLLRRAAGTVAAGTALSGAGVANASPAAAAAFPHEAAHALGDARVLPGDGRYETLSQGFNQRFTSEPRYIQLVGDDRGAVTTYAPAPSSASSRRCHGYACGSTYV